MGESHADLWRDAAAALCFIDIAPDGTLTKWTPPKHELIDDLEDAEPESTDDDEQA